MTPTLAGGLTLKVPALPGPVSLTVRSLTVRSNSSTLQPELPLTPTLRQLFWETISPKQEVCTSALPITMKEVGKIGDLAKCKQLLAMIIIIRTTKPMEASLSLQVHPSFPLLVFSYLNTCTIIINQSQSLIRLVVITVVKQWYLTHKKTVFFSLRRGAIFLISVPSGISNYWRHLNGIWHSLFSGVHKTLKDYSFCTKF